MDFAPSFFTSDIVSNIVYSSYIQDYFIFFALLLSGYIAIDYFLGYLIGKIPYINKVFNFKKFLSFLIILPLVIILVKIILNIDSSNIFLEKFLFITIFSSLSTLLFIYAGTKGLLKNDYGLIRLYNDYTFAIVIIIFSSYYYYKTQANNNINSITKSIKNKIHKEMMYLQNTNDVDYRLSELIVNYYVKSIDSYTNRLERKEKKIINDFNTKILNYDNKYIELSEKIVNSNKLITNLELTYENKIKIVDKEIDEEKLRLKAVYEEWKNNVESNINNLDKLSKKYKLEIEILENNKDLITHLQNELKLIKQKNSQLNIELLKVNDLISQNKNDIKNKDMLLEKLSNDVKKDTINMNLINEISSKNSINISNQIKEINKIKTIQVQLNKNKESLDLIKAEIDIVNKTLNKKQKKNLIIEDNNSTVKKDL
jgi:hypothetical protein